MRICRRTPIRFAWTQRFTFRQVFLNPEKHGKNLARDAAQLLAQLNQAGSKTDISALGDALMLDHQFDALPASEVAKLFGDEFATSSGRTFARPMARAGRVRLRCASGVRERTPGRRGRPRWRTCATPCAVSGTNARRLEANEKFYRELLKRYTVTIENAGAGRSKQRRQREVK